MEHAIGRIRFASWTTIWVCGATLAFLLISLPETEFIRMSDRDEKLRQIENTSDVRQLQGWAQTMIFKGESTSRIAMVLGTVSIGVFLFCIVNCVITLKNVRRLERGDK